MPNFFNFTLNTKPWAQFRQPASAYNNRTLTACLHSCSSGREALTTARDAQQHSLYRLETPSPKGSSYMARDALQHSLYRPETPSPKGSSHTSQGCSAAQSLYARDTSPTANHVHLLLMQTQLRDAEPNSGTQSPKVGSEESLKSVFNNPMVGTIYRLVSSDVTNLQPTSGSGNLSPTLGEEVYAPLWFKTSVLLLLLTLGSTTKFW